MSKMMRKLTILLLVMTLLLSGCSLFRKPISPVTNPVTQAPEVSSTDLYPASQALEGGSEQSGLNLSDIQIKTINDEQIQLELTFMVGNASMDMNESPSKGLPNYMLSYQEGVDRMIIRMEGLSYWTYRIYQEELQNPIIQGVFHQEPVDSDYTYIYVNTLDDYTYKAEEAGNRLIITMNKVKQQPSKDYYVTLNAFSEYENGAITSDKGMLPTLCDNGKDVILISSPMQSQAEAEEYMEQNRAFFESAAEGKELQVVELENNQLPSYNEDLLYRLAHYPIGEKNNQKMHFEAMIVNGRFLCWDPSYQQYAYVKPFAIEGAQESDVYNYKQLWVGAKGSEDAPLLDTKMESLAEAKFSYNGEYIAYIVKSKSMRMLNILSLRDGKVYAPSDDSFGIDTAAFVWAKDSNVLYGITGENDSKELLYCDLTDPNDVKIRAIADQEFSESSMLEVYDSYIYYLRRDPEDLSSRIYQLNSSNGRSKEIARGFSFELSPDGQSLLIYDTVEKNGNEEYHLYKLDIATKNMDTIYKGQNSIESYTWSREGKKIYYTVYQNGWEAKYPSTLYSYDMVDNSSAYQMDIVSGALFPADKDEAVLIMCLYTEQNKSVPATYIVE